MQRALKVSKCTRKRRSIQQMACPKPSCTAWGHCLTFWMMLDGAMSTSRRSRPAGRGQTPGICPAGCWAASGGSLRRMAASPLSGSLRGCGTRCSTRSTAHTSGPRLPCTRSRHQSRPRNPPRCPHAVSGHGLRTRSVRWGRATWPTPSGTARPPCRAAPGQRNWGSGTPRVDRCATAPASRGPVGLWSRIRSLQGARVTGPTRDMPPTPHSPSRAGSGPLSPWLWSHRSTKDQVSGTMKAK